MKNTKLAWKKKLNMDPSSKHFPLPQVGYTFSKEFVFEYIKPMQKKPRFSEKFKKKVRP